MSAWSETVGKCIFGGVKKDAVVAFHGLTGFASQRAEYFQLPVSRQSYLTTTDEVQQRLVPDMFM